MTEILTRSEKLKRMYTCDSSADGLFITGVLTTKIYCLPSCPARKPKAENVRFFRNELEAKSSGLRACKRCKPDEYYAGINPDRELLSELLGEFERNPASIKSIAEIVNQAGISQTKLYNLIEQYYHTTPGVLIHKYRIQAAKHLLADHKMSVPAVAFEVGYESVSAFYSRFKQFAQTTPGDYRKRVIETSPVK